MQVYGCVLRIIFQIFWQINYFDFIHRDSRRRMRLVTIAVKEMINGGCCGGVVPLPSIAWFITAADHRAFHICSFKLSFERIERGACVPKYIGKHLSLVEA